MVLQADPVLHPMVFYSMLEYYELEEIFDFLKRKTALTNDGGDVC